MSELTARILSASIDNYSCEDVVKIAYDILLDVNNVRETNGNRSKVEKDVTYMLFFYVMKIMPKHLSLNEAGLIVSKVEGRGRPYHHATVLYSIKKHNQRIEGGKRFGFEEYSENYKTFCNRLSMIRPILSKELDESGEQIMSKTKTNDKIIF